MAKRASQHLHRPCDEAGMRSCSAVADMAFQQLLNAAFAPPPGPRRPTWSSSPAGRGGRLPGSEVEILELREETPTSRGRGASRRAGKKRR